MVTGVYVRLRNDMEEVIIEAHLRSMFVCGKGKHLYSLERTNDLFKFFFCIYRVRMIFPGLHILYTEKRSAVDNSIG